MDYFDLEKSAKLSETAGTLTRVYEDLDVTRRLQGAGIPVSPLREERQWVSKALEFLTLVQGGVGFVSDGRILAGRDKRDLSAMVENASLLMEALESKNLALYSPEQLARLEDLTRSLRRYLDAPEQFGTTEIAQLQERMGELALTMSSYSRLYAGAEDSDD